MSVPVSPAERFNAAVAALEAPAPAPAPAPTEAPAPSTDPTPATEVAPAAPAPAPADPVAAPTTEAKPPEPAAPPVVEDEVAKIKRELDERRAQREAQKQPDALTAIRAELAAAQAKIEALTQMGGRPDLAVNMKARGAVQALRDAGVDPLEFFETFRKEAKDPGAFRAQTEVQRAAAELEALKKRLDEGDQRTAAQQQAAQMAQQERAYIELTNNGETFAHLSKLPPDKRIKRSLDKANELARAGHDPALIDDLTLARLVDADIRDELRLLTGTVPGVTTTTPAPVTDGAKPQPAKPPAASLTNDLASQSTGRDRQLSERERLAAAIAVMERGE